MHNIKIAAFDLDGTLLDSMKNITEENMNALLYAKSIGVELVPATGRLYDNLPPQLTEMCRYFILSNGATIYDSKAGKYIYNCCIPKSLALKIYDYADSLSCLYDSYVDNRAYMTRTMLENLYDYVPDKNYAKTMVAKRNPVDDLRQFIMSQDFDIQKIQFFFKDMEERENQLSQLASVFDNLLYVSTSMPSNIEINAVDAVKGKALENLCRILGIPVESSVAFGDGTNDLSMITDAGIGVCMSNGSQKCLDAADIITEYDCDNSGLGRELLKLLNYQEIR